MPPKKPVAKPAAKPAAKPGAAKAPAKKPAAKAGAAPAKAEPVPEKPKALPENEIGLKQINVVLGDTEGKIKESGRWPIVVDEAGRVMVFLRHRDCNSINALDSHEMAPEMIRKGLLGAIRYGKPFVMNLVEMGDIAIVEDRFNEIMPDLFNLVLSKKILEEDVYMKLVRPNDDEDYKCPFGVGEAFIFLFVSENQELSETTKGRTIIYRIV